MSEKKDLVIKVCGPAGTGMMQLGEVLSSALNSAGFFTLTYPEYPSVIRGGDNNVQIVISEDENLAPREKVDFIFAMDEKLLDLHRGDLSKNAHAFDAKTLQIYELAEVKENPIVKNTVAAGFVWKVLGLDISILQDAIKNSFDEKYVDINLKAAEVGFGLKKANDLFSLKPKTQKIYGATANEVFAQAIIKADCRYASIYPITPINSLLGYLSKTDIKMVVPEDEIFAALSTIGASYAGIRSVTATSGAGFSLMTEAISFSSMAEIPLVIILGQRSGPSSGMPTFSGQTDLNLAINPGHGEFQKIVLAPGDLKETMTLGQESFNLAEKYQVPVIVLTDKYLSESRFSTTDDFNKIEIKKDDGKRYSGIGDYKRYELTKDGISPRAFPGETTFITNSYEHDERGFSTDDKEMRDKMLGKREAKLKDLKGGFEVFGKEDAGVAIVGWGSTKNGILECLKNLQKNLKYIHVSRPWPISDDLKNELQKSSKIVVVENNRLGQLASLIEVQILRRVEKVGKDDGRPFFKEELVKLINEKL